MSQGVLPVNNKMQFLLCVIVAFVHANRVDAQYYPIDYQIIAFAGGKAASRLFECPKDVTTLRILDVQGDAFSQGQMLIGYLEAGTTIEHPSTNRGAVLALVPLDGGTALRAGPARKRRSSRPPPIFNDTRWSRRHKKH